MSTLTFDNLPACVGEILERLNQIEAKLGNETPEPTKELFDEYIPKSKVRGKFASGATLWNWENQGKLTSYGVGGKRFYKRSELENLIQPVKKKGHKR